MTIVDYLSNSTFSADGTSGFNVAIFLFFNINDKSDHSAW